MLGRLKRLIKIVNKKCTKCGNACENIYLVSLDGYLKEWCCNCTTLKPISKCYRCISTKVI